MSKIFRISRSTARLPAARRTWRNAALLIVLSLLAGGFGLSVTTRGERRSGGEGQWAGRVVWVSDGDTLGIVPLAGGRPRKVRLVGIDAPESCQRFGAQARDALRARVLQRQVQVDARGRDGYRRVLATIRIDGEDVGAWMVGQGNAWSYRWQRDPGPYAAQEAQARRDRRGLFADRAPQSPRDFRRSHGPCR